MAGFGNLHMHIHVPSKHYSMNDLDSLASPMSPTDSQRARRDTGFPEPFNSNCNTTLPHPDADLSPNATISQDDVTMEHAIKRHRLSFLHRHKKNVSHGEISPQIAALHSVLSVSNINTSSPTEQRYSQTFQASSQLSSKDGYNVSIESDERREGEMMVSPECLKAQEPHRRKSILRRWRRT